MANLSEVLISDPTLDAMDAQAEETNKNKTRKPPSLGASSIGDACERKVWLNWRMAKTEEFTAEQLYRFEDGFRVEDILSSRLSRVPSIKLRTVDPVTGYQFSMTAVDGHLRGRIDGRIVGLLQAPETEHVWEAKACDEKKQAALVKAKAEHGEKGALKAWDAQYYAQAVLYMHHLGITRHYLTCTSPGARHTISVRTNADPEYATSMLQKAERIKNNPNPPLGVSESPDYWQCKSCNFNDLCHKNRVPEVNCRTCLHSTPVYDGEWHCAKFQAVIPAAFQLAGCDKHLFIPSLIPYAKPVDGSQEENWVEYQKADGVLFRNGSTKPAYSSAEISACQDMNVLGDELIDNFRQQFNAKVIA